MSDKPRYLKQVIVVRKDLCMPTGKLGAMVAHAAMTFLINAWRKRLWPDNNQLGYAIGGEVMFTLTYEQARWLTELDPGIEETRQVSMAKIVCEVRGIDELVAVERAAEQAGLECHRVIDSGHAHNKPGTLVGIAIGPAWPERLDPVTGSLKVYR